MGPAALLVMKMRVRPQIGAIPRRPPLEVHRPHQVALDQRFQAVVNGGKGNCRELGFHTDINFIRRRMVAFPEEHAVNHFALWGSAEPAVGEPLRERIIVFSSSHE